MNNFSSSVGVEIQFLPSLRIEKFFANSLKNRSPRDKGRYFAETDEENDRSLYNFFILCARLNYIPPRAHRIEKLILLSRHMSYNFYICSLQNLQFPVFYRKLRDLLSDGSSKFYTRVVTFSCLPVMSRLLQWFPLKSLTATNDIPDRPTFTTLVTLHGFSFPRL